MNLKLFSLVVNRREEQCKFLLELCCNDVERYLLLEAALKFNHDLSFVPGDKDTVDKYLEKHTLDGYPVKVDKQDSYFYNNKNDKQ